MWKVLVEQQILHYLLGAVCLVGMGAELLLGLKYGRMIRASMVKNGENSSFMARYEDEIRQNYIWNKNVHNVDNFVEKYVNKEKLLGIFLYTWERLCGQMCIVSGFIVLISAVLTIYYQCGQAAIQNEILLDSFLCILWITIYVLADRSGQKKNLYKNLTEYGTVACMKQNKAQNQKAGEKELQVLQQAEQQLEQQNAADRKKKRIRKKEDEKSKEFEKKKQELAEEIRLERAKREEQKHVLGEKIQEKQEENKEPLSAEKNIRESGNEELVQKLLKEYLS